MSATHILPKSLVGTHLVPVGSGTAHSFRPGPLRTARDAHGKVRTYEITGEPGLRSGGPVSLDPNDVDAALVRAGRDYVGVSVVPINLLLRHGDSISPLESYVYAAAQRLDYVSLDIYAVEELGIDLEFALREALYHPDTVDLTGWNDHYGGAYQVAQVLLPRLKVKPQYRRWSYKEIADGILGDDAYYDEPVGHLIEESARDLDSGKRSTNSNYY